MISQTAEYALRAVTHLAEHIGAARTTQEIAEVTRVPADYLSKVLKTLVNAGIVSSQRGLYGGFRLVREAGDLPILEIIEMVSPLPRYRECPLEREHPGGSLCPLHRTLDDAMEGLETALRKMTIGDLIAADKAGSAMCGGKSRTELQIDSQLDPRDRKTPRGRKRSRAKKNDGGQK